MGGIGDPSAKLFRRVAVFLQEPIEDVIGAERDVDLVDAVQRHEVQLVFPTLPRQIGVGIAVVGVVERIAMRHGGRAVNDARRCRQDGRKHGPAPAQHQVRLCDVLEIPACALRKGAGAGRPDGDSPVRAGDEELLQGRCTPRRRERQVNLRGRACANDTFQDAMRRVLDRRRVGGRRCEQHDSPEQQPTWNPTRRAGRSRGGFHGGTCDAVAAGRHVRRAAARGSRGLARPCVSGLRDR